MYTQIETFQISTPNPVTAAIATYSDSAQVFKEDKDIQPVTIGKHKYMPWGIDNQMPYNVLEKVEDNTVLRRCQSFDSECIYGQGLKYNTDNASDIVKKSVENWLLHNNLPLYYLGVCNDLKQSEFAVTVITMSNDMKTIASISRRESIYCRFAPKNKYGKIPYLLYGQFRLNRVVNDDEVELIPILSQDDPLDDLERRLGIGAYANLRPSGEKKFAIITRMPSSDSTYYPIPSWASLFKDKWYDIYRLISIAKHAKLKNSAPLKYIVTINDCFWEKKFPDITDENKLQEKINDYKKQIVEFLTGAENSGKAIFAGFYVDPQGHKQEDITISILDQVKEGGDWETDIQEAINMICFAMGVHSNLVGSVPGNAQTNNSGSDKRELYTIAQARQKPYHDLLFKAHEIIIHFNKWEGVTVECPMLMLTTLDQHTDAKTTNPDNQE